MKTILLLAAIHLLIVNTSKKKRSPVYNNNIVSEKLISQPDRSLNKNLNDPLVIKKSNALFMFAPGISSFR